MARRASSHRSVSCLRQARPSWDKKLRERTCTSAGRENHTWTEETWTDASQGIRSLEGGAAGRGGGDEHSRHIANLADTTTRKLLFVLVRLSLKLMISTLKFPPCYARRGARRGLARDAAQVVEHEGHVVDEAALRRAMREDLRGGRLRADARVVQEDGRSCDVCTNGALVSLALISLISAKTTHMFDASGLIRQHGPGPPVKRTRGLCKGDRGSSISALRQNTAIVFASPPSAARPGPPGCRGTTDALGGLREGRGRLALACLPFLSPVIS